MAGAEMIGAILLFGLFVTVIAFLNVTAVPNAGLAAEAAHHDQVLAAFNQIQSEAEATGGPLSQGATIAGALALAPQRDAGGGFFSFFLAPPARSAGEVSFEANYGNITLTHTTATSPGTIADIGSPTVRFPMGRLTFDPHSVFRNAGVVQMENGGVVTTDLSSESLRFAPPISVTLSGGTTHVSVLTRTLNGTDANVGGTGSVRIRLATEAATFDPAPAANARNVTLRLETGHGNAWGSYLNATSRAAGLTHGVHYRTTVQVGAGVGGLDIVTWLVEGTGTGNDVKLTSGLAIYEVRFT